MKRLKALLWLLLKILRSSHIITSLSHIITILQNIHYHRSSHRYHTLSRSCRTFTITDHHIIITPYHDPAEHSLSQIITSPQFCGTSIITFVITGYHTHHCNGHHLAESSSLDQRSYHCLLRTIWRRAGKRVFPCFEPKVRIGL